MLFRTLLTVSAVLLSGLAISHGDSPLGSNTDQSLSPYFYVPTGDASVDALPLKHTAADVNIAGTIADVTITQVYQNKGSRPIEAIYVFPASTHAAVYAMRMKIDDRIIEAKIKEKQAARQAYETAKAEGKSASLLEQKRPNVFEMNVANILPGDEIEVVLQYTENLMPEDGIYEFVYPTVVGPRYSTTPQATASTDESFVETPYTQEGILPAYTFGLNVHVNSGIPLKDLRCQTHKIETDFTAPNKVDVKLAASEQQGGNRDFILQYRLRGEEVQSGLLLYEGEEENYFMLTVQPPKRVVASQIPAREYIFILDVSGSMNGYPLDISKKLMDNLFNRLSPQDQFNVMHFAGSATVMSEKSLPANPQNIQTALDHVFSHRGGGGTNLLPALHRALELPQTEGMSRTIVIATDGYVTVEKEAFELIRNKLGDANFFAFGIGTSVNRHIIEGMANVGMGEPFVVINQAEAMPQADKFMKYIEAPVLTDVEVNYNSFDVYDTEPFGVPDVLAERPITIMGKYRGEAKGSISITGVTGQGDYCQTFALADAGAGEENRALRYLWAREKIKMLDDFQKVAPGSYNQEEVTRLGLEYNLLTAYTSFVAVDNEVRTNQEAQPVKQPLPLPEGVPNTAIAATATTQPSYAITQQVQAGNVAIKAERVAVASEVQIQEVQVLSATPASSSGLYKVNVGGTSQYSVGLADRKAETTARENARTKEAERERKRMLNELQANMKAVEEESAAEVAEPKADDADFDAVTLEAPNEPASEIALTLESDSAVGGEIFMMVEQMPAFPGGEEALYKFIAANLTYPEQARELSIQGTVYVRFIVLKDGTINKIAIVRGVHELLDKEAIRVMEQMPVWNPGKQQGKPVATQMILPIKFSLN